MDRPGAVFQEQHGEGSAHQPAERLVVPSPSPADLQSASRVPRPLLRMSAVSVDAPQDLGSAADMPPPQPLCTGSLTKAGLYRTIRRVLDIDGWYLMATEYLECRRCKKKVGGWSQGIIRQLPPTYSCQFPAVLTYK